MKIYIKLKGGLGNQMFQYAYAYSLAIDAGAKLILDNRTEFKADTYGRRYELGRYNINAEAATLIARFPFLFYKILRRVINVKFANKYSRILFNLFVEDSDESTKYADFLELLMKGKNVRLDGYWQDYLAFRHNMDSIVNSFVFATPVDINTQRLLNDIDFNKSIAVGMRLYEEIDNSLLAIKNSNLSGEMLAAIRKIISKEEIRNIYFFCTHVPKEIDFTEWPAEVKLIVADEGYSDPVDMMNLYSKFKCRLFNNSTFYWWGACLGNFKNSKYENINFIVGGDFPANLKMKNMLTLKN